MKILLEHRIIKAADHGFTEKERSMKREKKRVLAEGAVRLAQRWLKERIPWIGGVFGLAEEQWTEARSGTDGVCIFWNPQDVCGFFSESTALLARRYLHLMLHGLYLHPMKYEKQKEEWTLACDLLTEYRIDRMAVPGFARPIPAERSRVYRMLQEASVCWTEEAIAGWVRTLSIEEKNRLMSVFCWDDHGIWKKEETGNSTMGHDPERLERLRKQTAAVHRWRTVWEQIPLREQEHRRQAGGSAGTQVSALRLREDRQYDYRNFLKSYAVWGEVCNLDLDSFDMGPYWYSRERYDRLRILEPLEFREVQRLQELVIAIDTSGSCSGAVVRQFLEQTWEIFRERENFFETVHIDIFQCDCVIQEQVRITCWKEWQSYVDQMQIKGHGDTDFTPVFRRVDEMIRQGEFRNLKGLLYFTDGDGIYPDWEPDYETAFIFLNPELKKGRPPAWAKDLTLEVEMEG